MATVSKMPSANSGQWQQARSCKRAFHDGKYEVQIEIHGLLVVKARLYDFSPAGLGAISGEAILLHRGQLVRVYLPYLDDDPLWEYAVVRHSSGIRHGFEFVYTSHEDFDE